MMQLKGMILNQALGFHLSIKMYAMIKQSIKSLLYFLTFIGFTSIGIAQTQIGNDIDAESGKGEEFGGSVSISNNGKRVAIGDENNDGNGDDAGHVRAFEFSNNSWSQLGSDIDGEAAGDNFGVGVSMSSDGKRIAVGAENNDSWGQIIRKYVNDSALEDYLGSSVAISGDYAIAGTPGDDSGGAAYILVRSGGSQTWTQHDKIEASDEAAGDSFGISVSISGDYAIVGAYGDGSYAGSAYIFIRSGTSWSQQAKLTASDAATNDNFGYRVSISGSYAIVGAYGDDSNKGSAYIFIRSGTSWSQQQKLLATDGVAPDNFGISVSIDDEYAIIGANNDDAATGSAYIFNRSGTTWTQQSHLRASDQAANDYFGVSVDINKGSNGGHAVVGAYQDDDTADGSGSAYIYKLSSDLTSWRIDKKVVANDPAQGDRYGASVAIDEDYIAVGAPYKNANADDQGTIYVIERKAGVSAGSAQVFNWTGSSWSQIGQTLLGRIELAKFGVSVSLDNDGDIVAIGAPDLNNGLVRVYKYGTDASWAQLGSDIVGEASGDFFGISVSLDSDGSHVAIGGENNDAAGNNAGHARVYEFSNNSWSQVRSDIDGEAAGDLFGHSVSLDSDGSHVAISGEENDAAGNNAGHARVYEFSNNSWSQLGSDIDGEAAGDLFGVSVDLDFDGSHVAIGGLENDGGGSNAGYVRVLEYNGTRWREVGYDINGGGSDDYFGASVSIDSAGNRVAGGGPGENVTGYAAIFDPIDIREADVSGYTLAADNSYIDIVWDEKIYSTPHSTGDYPRTSGGVDITDGYLTFIRNGGNATGITLTGIKATDNTVLGSASALVGGETTIRAFFSTTGAASGVEQFMMGNYADAFFDPHGVASSAETRGPITLNDLLGPTMVITAAEGADGFTSDDATLSLTFTSSEATTFFALEDITVTNGALSSFSATSTTVYTATFTPTSDGAVTIDVAADTFSDASNNNNTAADQFNWTYDTTGPTMTITAAEGIDGFTSGDATLSLTFTASEITNNFAADDITVTNGTISGFSASSGSSSETFLNFDGTDDYVIIENASPVAPPNNTSRSGFAWIKASAQGGNVFSWGERKNNNRWSILLGGGGIGVIGENNDVKFHGSVELNTWVYVGATFDGSTLTLYVDGVVVKTQSMSTDYATSENTPILIGKLPYDEPSGEYFKGGIDEVSIWNNALTTAEVIALYNSGSRLDASTNSGNYVSSSSLVGYWKFNEGTGTSVTDASGNNNGVVNGASWGTSTSSRVYTATLTPIAAGEVTIDVAAATFTDATSNNNTAAVQFNWFYDNTGPTMAITAAEGADGFSSNDATLSLTFTSNEATTNFEIGDISVSNGTLSSFVAVSNTVYTAILTPIADGEVTIDVLANTFTDALSNNNTASDQFNWFYDVSPPIIVFSPINGAIEVALKEKITLTFNEPIRNIDNSVLTDDNVDALIRLKTPIHSGTDIPFDATITNYGLFNAQSNSLPISYVYAGRTISFNTVSLNGGDNTISVDPGASISISVEGTYTHTSGYCPGCIVQIYARMNDVFNLCLVNGSTSGGGSFNETATFTAPTTPGTYYVNPTGTLDFFCHDSKSVSTTFGSSTLATIVVLSDSNKNEGIITIVPTNDFSYSQTVWVGIGESVEDTLGNAIVSAAASFTTTDTNRAPVLYTIGNKTTFEDAAFSLVMSATDADLDTVTFAGASSNSNVTIAINDSLLTLYPATNWHGTAVITIIAVDNGPRTLTDSESFILTVVPVNDAPTALALAPDTVQENSPTGMHVGLFTATDIDTGETFTYNLISGDGSNDADNDKFLIVNDSLRTDALLDYETDDTLVIRVQVKDIGGLSYETSKMVFVKNMPEPEIALSISSINFGKVIVNRTGKKTISLSSVGLDTMVIDSVVVSGVGYSMDTKAYPVKLAPNLSTDFTFSFYPQVAGTSFGQANYYSNNISGIKQVSLTGEGVNDTIPPVIVPPTTPITSSENQDVAITMNVTDENNITIVNLYYQVGGSLEVLEQAATSNGDGTYTATVNKDMVGINGLSYYYMATDEYSNVRYGDTLNLDIKYGQNRLTSSITGTAYPTGVPKSKWRLISIPTHIDLNTINETIGDELGKPASDQTWRLYEDKGNANWLEAQAIKIGRGYWLHQRMKDDLSFSVGSGKSVDTRSHTIRIPSGWSLIGNPYPFTLKVSFDHSDVFGPLTYSKNSIDELEGWDSETNTFAPWEGYAIYNRTSDSVSLVLNPLDQNNIQSSRTVDGWQINISADNGEFADLYNLIGRSSEASNLLDQLDNPEPPKLEQYISLAMDRKEWGIELPLTSDIRSMDKINGQWDMYLDTKGINGSITLETTLKGDFPLDASAILFDPIERKSYDLLDGLDIIITRVNDHYDYPLSVLVGSLDFVLAKTDELISQLPESFSLGQNYPNPFNPVTNIPFTISVPSYVQISIYNLLGEKVSVLESRWFDMGQFNIQWNGKDEYGNQLSTGVYIYSLESAEFRQAKKLILLK